MNSTENTDNIKTTCSVWEAFDRFQLCHAIGPQIKHYYRYGELRQCADLRDELYFCLRMKTKPTEEASELIRERELEKLAKKTTQRPSSAIWKLREGPPVDFPPSKA